MTTDTVGGVWTYAMQLIDALRPLGVRVALATMGPAASDEQREAAGRICEAVVTSEFDLEWMDDPWRDVAAAGRWLHSLCGEVEPDVVHLNGYAHAALPLGTPRLVVAHSCVLSWWRAVKGEAAPAQWRRYERHVSAGLHRAEMVVAPTFSMLGALEACYGPLPRRTAIHNGIDPRPWRAGEKRAVVFGAGRLWDEAKNLGACDRVAPRVAWPVELAGPAQGPGGGVVRPRHAKWLGVLTPEQMQQAMSRAAIFASPARYEPFGLGVLEAALSGCALVLGDIPTFRELWTDCALFVGNDDELTDALNTLIEAEDRRAALASAAARRAAGLTAEAMARQYLVCYERLVQEQEQGPRRPERRSGRRAAALV